MALSIAMRGRCVTESNDLSLGRCLTVTGDQGIRDFPMKIKGTTGSLKICVRDHECEDGDKIRVDVEGRTIFSGEIDNDWDCYTLEVWAGESYAVELTALNGTGYKGNCSHRDVNTGEIRVTGENMETQVWRHRGGAGSKARIIVETVKPPFPMPEMVVIPAGSFRMGCYTDCVNEKIFGLGGDTWGKPVHEVRIRSFELSKYEVTLEEYDVFTDATGRERADDRGFGRGRRPVFVLWDDAVAYTQWLSSQTGKNYRLPSEAEWEYAARAGTTTKYGWRYEINNSRSRELSEEGSFPPNAWGLHNMLDRVSEWVQDCVPKYSYGYEGAPSDGSAWEVSGGCTHVMRGVPHSRNRFHAPRPAARELDYGGRDYSGFRVARSF